MFDHVGSSSAAGTVADLTIGYRVPEPILEVASPRGLLMNIRCSSPAEADDLVRYAVSHTSGRKP